MSIETDETSTILIADGSFTQDEDWLKDLSAVPACQGDYCLPQVTIGGKDRDSGSPTQTAASEKLLPPPPPEDDDAIDFYDLYGDGDGKADKAEDAGAKERGNEGSEGGTEKKQQWIDGGQFTADEQGRIRKTVSEDGTKVREFNYTGSDPNQITEITIDGNRFYKRGEVPNEWHYFVDGQFRGIWRGDVDMQKNGLYGYTATKDKVTHEFGSARQEIRSYKRGDDQPAPLPQPDDNRGDNRRDEERRKADGNGEGDKTRPDRERPPVEIKEKYGTADAAEAVRVAREAGLPLVVHVGANFCGPCRTMERDVWPTIEHELKGQAVFLHVIAEEVEAGAGGELASQIGSTAGSYPTILVASASQTNGKPSIVEHQRASTMNLQQTRAFLTNARARWRK